MDSGYLNQNGTTKCVVQENIWLPVLNSDNSYNSYSKLLDTESIALYNSYKGNPWETKSRGSYCVPL
jgi:hypothetical protein